MRRAEVVIRNYFDDIDPIEMRKNPERQFMSPAKAESIVHRHDPPHPPPQPPQPLPPPHDEPLLHDELLLLHDELPLLHELLLLLLLSEPQPVSVAQEPSDFFFRCSANGPSAPEADSAPTPNTAAIIIGSTAAPGVFNDTAPPRNPP
jgi:hypothetical protein